MKATSVLLNLNLTPFSQGPAEQLLHCQYLGCWGPWTPVCGGTLRWTDHDNDSGVWKLLLLYPGNVTAILGKPALLNCRVAGVGNKTVSWLRHEGTHLLTAGRYNNIMHLCLIIILELSTKFRESFHIICPSPCVNFRFIDTSSIGFLKCVDTTWTMTWSTINYLSKGFAFHNMHILSPSWQAMYRDAEG